MRGPARAIRVARCATTCGTATASSMHFLESDCALWTCRVFICVPPSRNPLASSDRHQENGASISLDSAADHYDLGAAIFNSLTTCCLPAISSAKLATLLFSWSLRTTPFNVTCPLIDTTLTLCA